MKTHCESLTPGKIRRGWFNLTGMEIMESGTWFLPDRPTESININLLEYQTVSTLGLDQ